MDEKERLAILAELLENPWRDDDLTSRCLFCDHEQRADEDLPGASVGERFTTETPERLHEPFCPVLRFGAKAVTR